jgi:ABC-type multidrug transport system fused ATPase/permease subunit
MLNICKGCVLYAKYFTTKIFMTIQVFVIAHRLETVRRADTIYFLENGRILEQGTHSSLLALGGHYATLYGTKDTT